MKKNIYYASKGLLPPREKMQAGEVFYCEICKEQLFYEAITGFSKIYCKKGCTNFQSSVSYAYNHDELEKENFNKYLIIIQGNQDTEFYVAINFIYKVNEIVDKNVKQILAINDEIRNRKMSNDWDESKQIVLGLFTEKQVDQIRNISESFGITIISKKM